MGRRNRRGLRRRSLAVLTLAGLLAAAPASTSEQDVMDSTLGPGCSSVVGDEGDMMEAIGTPNLSGLNCPGAPDGCGGWDYQ